MSSLSRIQNLLLPVGIIICLMVILTPLPASVIDLLLIANIAISVIVLMTAIYVKTPLEFSVFPTVLLSTVLARLVLNIATTRLILTQAASDGMNAAGGVINSFGRFVAGDQLLVGLILFSIIAVIQFVVITKGATRISEVTARFVLDGLPGRQMAIDADLNARVIDEQEAWKRRAEILCQTDFYGAMDGASKFVRGDAVASVFITIINIVGGLTVGVLHYGMAPTEALTVFTKLTIGDGLVSQVPALLISLAAGILVTRSKQSTNLSLTLIKQVFTHPEVLGIAGVFLLVLVLTSLPKLPLFMLGTSFAGVAFVLSRNNIVQDEPVGPKSSRKKTEAAAPMEPRIEDYLSVDPIEMELGIGLLKFADKKRGGTLLAEMNRLRQQVALEMGIVMPKVRVRDNLQLGEDTYRIRVNGDVVSEATFPLQGLIAVSQDETAEYAQESFEHPILRSAFKIDVEDRRNLESSGAMVMDGVRLLIRHLRTIVEDFSAELLTRDATRHLIEELKTKSPAVVDELIPSVLKLNQVQQVLKNLLAERLPIRQLSLILESLGDGYRPGRTIRELTETVRQQMARTICQQYRDASHRLYAVTLDPKMENLIGSSISMGDDGFVSQMSRQLQTEICENIKRELKHLDKIDRPPILLVDRQVRPLIRPLVHQIHPQLVALSYNEITVDTKVVSLGIVSREEN